MELVTREDYLNFIRETREVEVGKVKVALRGPYHPTVLGPPQGYEPETETVWSFPDRGDWASHSGNYRGNWSPYIPRNLILRYTQPGDTVLDQMCGSGTSLVECRLLGRRGIGVDVNPAAIMVARDRLEFEYTAPLTAPPELSNATYIGDARNLDLLDSTSVDLIATHPPYAGIISYGNHRVEGDLSNLKLGDYVREMHSMAQEAFRVLRPGSHCAILIGDTRQHLHYIPISARNLEVFLDVGFFLREDIIKLQWKTKTTRERWRGSQYKFYKIAHEHLYIFRKPSLGERPSMYKHSSKWWESSHPRGTEMVDAPTRLKGQVKRSTKSSDSRSSSPTG